MTIYEIPLSAEPQSFQIALGSNTYNVTVSWNSIATCWVVDLADDVGTPILQGLPLVTGLDLLRQYQYLGLGGSLIAQSDTNPDLVPEFDTLGSSSHLYFVTA